jgi:hypothetical protein
VGTGPAARAKMTRNGLQPASATHMHSTSTVMMDRACLALIDIID